VTNAVASCVTPGPHVAVHTPGVCGAGPTVRHPQPSAFVADLEQFDPEIVQGLHPVHVAVTHHAEDRGDTLSCKRLGQALVHLHAR
jgi:hypothetical protein